ncbi:Alpha/Beta hydrolase protein [Gorgonomyces haynaldii]|nr:Alpha/Beta hydrolase protein [Gorgonomyces haynaldii]
MIDHVLGRPSPNFKRVEIILTTLGLLWYLKRTKVPFMFKRINQLLRNTQPWKIVLLTLTLSHLVHNGLVLFGLQGPEPLSKMYTRSFFRATYVTTALDAGYFSCLSIKNSVLREALSAVLSVVYLFYPDAAEEKCKRFRMNPTTQVLRSAWDKTHDSPVLWLLTLKDRGFLKIRRNLEIPLPRVPGKSVFTEKRPTIRARLYFDGSESELKGQQKLIFVTPGGGFVAVKPENHDAYLSQWARLSKLPIVAIDYAKAPEFPYPYGLEECFDAYKSVTESNGRVIGLDGWEEEINQKLYPKDPIKIVLVGDSAGGNMAVNITTKCIQDNVHLPSGLLLLYPFLSYAMECWMQPQHLDLMRSQSHIEISQQFVQSKTRVDRDAPLQNNQAPKSLDLLSMKVDRRPSYFDRFKPDTMKDKRHYVHSYLAMTSRMLYTNDRILPTHYMRAIGLMYLAGSPIVPDLEQDYFLSPVKTPDNILAQFPKTFIMCGEQDPIVDDTFIFANRLRQAKHKAHLDWKRMKSEHPRNQKLDQHPFQFEAHQMVRSMILPGLSHGYFLMYGLLKEADQAVKLTHQWLQELLEQEDHDNDEMHRLTKEMLKIEEEELLKRRRTDMSERVFV